VHQSFGLSSALPASSKQLHHLLVVRSAKASDGIPAFERRVSRNALKPIGAPPARAGVNVRERSWVYGTHDIITQLGPTMNQYSTVSPNGDESSVQLTLVE
jgi:hypothetical protein